MRLARFQREFIDAVLAPRQPGDPRLAVYHRSSRANREGALAAAYPVVLRLVGEAYFSEAAARYAEASPSRSGDLGAYGSGFGAFLAAYPHARELPYLADVARLEWALHESRHAAQAAGLDYAALGAVPAEALGRLRMRLRPCVRLVASSYPILAIWEANQAGRDGTPERTQGGESVVVRRGADLEAVPAAVGTAEWTLLQCFARGEPLAAAAAECGRRGLAFEPALAALAALEVLGGFELEPQ
jgi:hypothetical protein